MVNYLQEASASHSDNICCNIILLSSTFPKHWRVDYFNSVYMYRKLLVARWYDVYCSYLIFTNVFHHDTVVPFSRPTLSTCIRLQNAMQSCYKKYR